MRRSIFEAPVISQLLSDKLDERLPGRWIAAGGLGQHHKVCRHLGVRFTILQVLLD